MNKLVKQNKCRIMYYVYIYIYVHTYIYISHHYIPSMFPVDSHWFRHPFSRLCLLPFALFRGADSLS